MSISLDDYFDQFARQTLDCSPISFRERLTKLLHDVYSDHKAENRIKPPLRKSRFLNLFHLAFLGIGIIRLFLLHMIDSITLYKNPKKTPIPAPSFVKIFKLFLNGTLGVLEMLAFTYCTKIMGYFIDSILDCLSCQNNVREIIPRERENVIQAASTEVMIQGLSLRNERIQRASSATAATFANSSAESPAAAASLPQPLKIVVINPEGQSTPLTPLPRRLDHSRMTLGVPDLKNEQAGDFKLGR